MVANKGIYRKLF